MSSPGASAPDVLVVGGGIHGCAVARELALRGRRVTVLERSVPGAEASSAAGGILGPHLEADHGEDFLELGRFSLGLYAGWARALQEESGVTIGFRRCGGLQLCFDPTRKATLEAQAQAMADVGLPARWLSARACRELEPQLGEALGGIHFPDEAQVEPRSLMAALTIAARKAGAEFVTDTVLGLEHEPLAVRCASGLRQAEQVVLAAGAWSAALPGAGLRSGSVEPARGQMLRLKGSEPPCGAVLFSERGYVVPRADGTVLAGSTLEFAGFRKAVTVEGVQAILELAVELLPCLRDAEIDDAWSGFRPWTPDQLPILGASQRPGLWLSTGHYRNGILLAPGSARVLASLMDGDEPEIPVDSFSPSRFA